MTVSEEQLAKCLWEAEFDGEAYPWEKQTSAEQLTYRHQARKVLRDFVVSEKCDPPKTDDAGYDVFS